MSERSKGACDIDDKISSVTVNAGLFLDGTSLTHSQTCRTEYKLRCAFLCMKPVELIVDGMA